jgi:hypothetical protein
VDEKNPVPAQKVIKAAPINGPGVLETIPATMLHAIAIKGRGNRKGASIP